MIWVKLNDKGTLGPGMRKSFTLVEVLIVAAIVGILAAIVIPEFQSYAQQAKEVAAKDNLRIFRNTIELYAVNHRGIPPGYPDDDPASVPDQVTFFNQLVIWNEYLREIPENPFNRRRNIRVLKDTEEFPTEPDLNIDNYGWIYQPAIKRIKLYWPGTDSKGVRYFDY